MFITKIKKHEIDLYDIYINIVDDLETDKKMGTGLPLDYYIKEEITRYLDFLGIEKKDIKPAEYNKIFTNLKASFNV